MAARRSGGAQRLVMEAAAASAGAGAGAAALLLLLIMMWMLRLMSCAIPAAAAGHHRRHTAACGRAVAECGGERGAGCSAVTAAGPEIDDCPRGNKRSRHTMRCNEARRSGLKRQASEFEGMRRGGALREALRSAGAGELPKCAAEGKERYYAQVEECDAQAIWTRSRDISAAQVPFRPRRRSEPRACESTLLGVDERGKSVNAPCTLEGSREGIATQQRTARAGGG